MQEEILQYAQIMVSVSKMADAIAALDDTLFALAQARLAAERAGLPVPETIGKTEQAIVDLIDSLRGARDDIESVALDVFNAIAQ